MNTLVLVNCLNTGRCSIVPTSFVLCKRVGVSKSERLNVIN